MGEVDAYVDFTGRGGVPITFDNYRDLEIHRLEQKLPAMHARHGQLPSLIVRVGPYVDLLVEARRLYEEGHFYSCVAMAGITGERILKDSFLATVRVVKGEKSEPPTAEEIKELEEFQAENIRRFLLKCGVLPQKSAKSLQDLMKLRNDYAHAGGKEPEKDSQRALQLLMDVVDGTVCLLELVIPGLKQTQDRAEQAKKSKKTP